jgi:hypothetical protein
MSSVVPSQLTQAEIDFSMVGAFGTVPPVIEPPAPAVPLLPALPPLEPAEDPPPLDVPPLAAAPPVPLLVVPPPAATLPGVLRLIVPDTLAMSEVLLLDAQAASKTLMAAREQNFHALRRGTWRDWQ